MPPTHRDDSVAGGWQDHSDPSALEHEPMLTLTSGYASDSAEEYGRSLHGAGETRSRLPERTFSAEGQLRRVRERFGSKAALVTDTRTLSYAELDALSGCVEGT